MEFLVQAHIGHILGPWKAETGQRICGVSNCVDFLSDYLSNVRCVCLELDCLLLALCSDVQSERAVFHF